ncbi:S8 family serine peptidase [Kribbella sandramycini]
MTGDKVRVLGGGAVQATPGPGRAGTRFRTLQVGDAVSVVPLDALPLIAQKRLDTRLFDLTALAAAGYDDASRKTLPLIIDGPAGAVRGTTSRALPAVGAMAAAPPKDQLPGVFSGLRTAGIKRIWLDGRRELLLDHSVPQIGAPAAWAAGYTGRGVKVAVLDSGVDAAHPDFSGRLVTEDFTGTGLSDAVGHGTHVGSIIGGSGAASDGKYRGVAPDAQLLSGKVCEDRGCSDSAILAGMDWAVREGAKIVNLSLGGGDTPTIDPLEEAVNRLTAEHGTLFVIAAGNYGPDARSIDSPGSAAAALTVGAVDRNDVLADFSGRGPTADQAPKPDVTAPGVDIVAAKSADGVIGEPVGDSYLKLSGTSMATPHVAGAAALLAQEHPDWRADRLKAALMTTARPNADLSPLEQGSGRIDVAAARGLKVTTDTGVLAFAAQQWPHSDDVAESKRLTYTNDSDEPVTLQLSATLQDEAGQAAPAGALALSASTLTVPARGTAQVTVTSNTNHSGTDGRYNGQVVAKAAGVDLAVRMSVFREAESYNLTIKHLDRTGAPTADYTDTVVDHQLTGWPIFAQEADGITNLRLPKGKFLLDSTIGTGRNRTDGNLLVQPLVDLSTDRTIVVDARQAKPMTVSVPEPTAREALLGLSYSFPTPGGRWGSGIAATLDEPIYVTQLGPSIPGLASIARSQWAKPGDGEFFANSPYLYALAWPLPGRIFDGLSKNVQRSELAVVRETVAAQAPDTTAVLSVTGEGSEELGGIGYGYSYKLPAGRSVYALAKGVRWGADALLINGDAGFVHREPTTYVAGRTYNDDWGRATIGPALRVGRAASFQRTGDGLLLQPRQADSTDHYGDQFGLGTLSVHRNGELVTGGEYPDYTGRFENIEVPTGPGDYRVALETKAQPFLDASTRTWTAWSFRSDTTSGPTGLPVWAVRFRPAVDVHNVLRSGPSHQLPISVEHVPGTPVGKLRSLAVQTSTDNGVTWQEAKLRALGNGKYTAAVPTPAGATSVWLKAKAVDSKGNAVEQVIERAYKVAR